MEMVIRERQTDYYAVLAASDKTGQCSAFIEFMLATLLEVLEEATATAKLAIR